MHNADGRLINKILNYALTIFLGMLAIVQMYPFLWLILGSFKDNSEIFGENVIGLPHKLLWKNYWDAMFGRNLGTYFMNSVFVTTITIIVSGILACMLAYAISRMKWKLSQYVFIIFLLGLMIPGHAAMLPIFIILKKMKIYNTYLALIIPYIAYALPFAISILVGFLQRLPRELEESAFIDGASIYKAFASIIVPIIRPAIATVSIFAFLGTWNELMFATTYVSADKYRTLTVGIMQMIGIRSTEWGPVFAGLLIASLPTIIIYLFLSEQVQQSLISGAVKG